MLQTLITTCLAERDALELARGQMVQWEKWLLPLSADSPVGDDPCYCDDFQRMREEVNKITGADTGLICRLAETLLTTVCKDVRVATYYLWARLHGDGEAGLADGLMLLAGLVDRFGERVLPARPNSRRTALEWLAGNKMLDSLDRYPEVAKSELVRIVAALALLEHAVGAWSELDRPALGALYGALELRLAQSGGLEAVVPQHSAVDGPGMLSSSAGLKPGLRQVQSGRDLLEQGKALSRYLREQPQGWLASHRLMKSLRWDTVHLLPQQEKAGNTRLTPPRSDCRAQLKRLYLQQSWDELLEQVERMYAEGVNHFWLDLQWYACQALSKQGQPFSGWADLVKQDLGMLLARLPGLENLSWNDGTPFADDVTRGWIAQQASGSAEHWAPVTSVTAPADGNDILALESEALAQADSDGVDAALAWLAARPGTQTIRQRWLLRLLMARVAEQYGKNDLALHLLGELNTTSAGLPLADWAPELSFEVKARLLKLMRLKAQRNDADKTALARRMEALLAALVAIDPVRAAILCS
ncbi:type VI secretion system protein TssA [Sodalis ligni]|uniref:type VI secretion system protein TssA n=1 Tax=Sodalis ligni TaxID=2697027 RepID=UPI00193ED877|nr:type VI secretion system protein TssA [Sodalis ligni]QWA11031.1 type VI secretion system protein TssA [Sodalis ligni]